MLSRAVLRTSQFTAVAAAAAVVALTPVSAAGAQTPQPGSAATAPDVGQMAPDFSLPGATRYGLLKNPVKLSDFRGQTVVVAFFPKARTKG
jgi:thioredoxin-dependent peroxiredoxin